MRFFILGFLLPNVIFSFHPWQYIFQNTHEKSFTSSQYKFFPGFRTQIGLHTCTLIFSIWLTTV
jgi:hypothetical protein